MYFIIICILVLLAKSPSTNTYMAVQIIRIAKDEFNVCLCVSKRNRYNSEIIWCLKIFLPIYTFDATANFFFHWNFFSFTQLQHRFILIMSTYIWVYNNCGTLWNNKKKTKNYEPKWNIVCIYSIIWQCSQVLINTSTFSFI